MSSPRTPKLGAAVVVSAGKMMKTVKVRMIRQEWNKHLRKYYAKPFHLLVSDPTSALREGDVISLAPERAAKTVYHTVDRILAPFGVGLDERPAVYTAAEREALRDEDRRKKVQRRASRGILSAVQEARRRGWPVERSTEEVSSTEHGREVKSDGAHEFGKINDETQRSSQRAKHRTQKAIRNEEGVDQAETRPTEEVAR